MRVFDATTKVKTAVSDPLTDHKLLHPKSLSWGAITSPSAVAGTNGAHCDLVHGDQWHEIKGNHKQNIQQNQTIKVVGKHKETLVDSCYQNIIGPHIVLNNDVRNETRLGVFTKTSGFYWHTEPGYGEVSQMDMNFSNIIGFQAENTSVNVQSSVLSIGLTGVVAQATGASANVTGATFEQHAWSNHDKDFENNIKPVKDTINELSNNTHAISVTDGFVKNSDGVFVTEVGVCLSFTGFETHTGPAFFDDIEGFGLVVPA